LSIVISSAIAWPRTHPAYLHAHIVQVLTAPSHHIAIEPHQKPDFLCRPFPVLRGKGVETQPFDADFDCAANNVDDHGLAHLVAFDARESTLGGPAAIAVHHNRDVVGQLVGGDPRSGRLGDVLRGSAGAAVG